MMRRIARMLGISLLVFVAVILNVVLIALLGKYLGWNAFGSDSHNTQLSGLACVVLLVCESYMGMGIWAFWRKSKLRPGRRRGAEGGERQ